MKTLKLFLLVILLISTFGCVERNRPSADEEREYELNKITNLEIGDVIDVYSYFNNVQIYKKYDGIIEYLILNRRIKNYIVVLNSDNKVLKILRRYR